MKTNIVLLALLIPFFSGCLYNNNNLHNYFEQLAIVPKNNKYVVVIVPMQGCGSCIQTWVNFIKNNNDDKETIFVLTSYLKKDITNNFSDIDRVLTPNLFMDTLGLAYKYNLITTSPSAFFMKNNTLVRNVDLNANNSQQIYNEIKLFIQVP